MEENNKLNENLVFDLNEIKKFVFEEDVDLNKTRDSEITETWGVNDEGKQELLSKVVHEVKGSDFSGKQTIRYDLLKTFMQTLDNIEFDTSITPMSLGERMVLNTMVNYGLIKEINQ